MVLKKYVGYIPLIAILVVVGFFFFIQLGRNAFWDWDECLYAQYTTEMPLAGHYLTNIWNGYIDLQKPPLYTWLLQIPRMLFGANEFSLRLLSALAGMGIIASVYMFCKKYFSQTTALFASLILLASEVFVIYSLRLNTDIVYTLSIFLACWSWLVSYKKPRFVYIAALLFGVSTMLKGIGTTQFLLAIFVTLCIYPKKQAFINFTKMVLLYLVLVIPWHLIAYQQYGNDFIRIYIFENIIQRGKYPIEFHRERWWFYFVQIYRELNPWIFAGVIFPIVFLGHFLKRKFAALQTHHYIIFIVIVILIPLSSLVRFQTRIAWYALPLYPFIAVYLGYNLDLFMRYISQKVGAKQSKHVFLIACTALVLGLSLDAGRLLTNEVKPFETERMYSQRELAINKARTYPQKKLLYLVPFGERQAPEILPPTEEIDMTWVYGGHPCAVYYSKKKVDYFYTIDAFKKVLGQKGALYLRHKDDEEVVKESKPTVLYSNDEYVLFTY